MGAGKQTVESRADLAFPKDVADSFRVLQVVSPALLERALAYVRDGVGPDVLLTVANEQNNFIFAALDRPGTVARHGYHSGKYPEDEAIAKAFPDWSVTKSTEARARLYGDVGLLAPQQFVRLARLLLAARAGRELERPTRLGPDWFPVLLIDAMHPFANSGTYERMSAQWTAKNRSGWTPEFLAKLLAADRKATLTASEDLAADSRIVLSTLFDRVALGQSWDNRAIDALTRLVGLSAYVIASRETLANLLPGFTLDGRRAFLDFVKRHPSATEPLIDLVVSLVRDSSKLARADALAIVASLSDERRVQLLEPLLMTLPAAAVEDVVSCLTRVEDGIPAIRRALEVAVKTKGVAAERRSEVLRQAIERYSVRIGDEDDYERIPFVAPIEQPLGDEFVAALLRTVASVIEQSRAELQGETPLPPGDRRERHFKYLNDLIGRLTAFSHNDATEVARYLSGEGAAPAVLATITDTAFNKKHKGLTVRQAARLYANAQNVRRGWVPWWSIVAATDGERDIDLRAYLDALTVAGYATPLESVAELGAPRWGGTLEGFSDDHLWPFFDEHPEILKQLIGIESGGVRWGNASSDDVGHVLQIAAMMPTIPSYLKPRITELALGEGKTHRSEAQHLLESQPGVVDLAVGALGDRKPEVRASAARWLARLGDTAAVRPLRQAFTKEKREIVRAAILTALEVLGDDISKDLAPARLLAEATSGLKAPVPASLQWFPMAALPKVKWAASGKPVPPEVLRWWVVLAVRLKEPGGGGLVGRYLSLLDARSQQMLGDFVLSAWIAQDTRRASDLEARAFAEVEAPKRYAQWQNYVKRNPAWAQEAPAKYTVAQWFEIARREKASTYLGSAINDKGMLALASGTAGVTLVATLQRFMKDHYLKRAQVEALISVAAASDDLAATQLLLAAARRHRTASVQVRARELVEDLAERRGWTPDELADRTIPSAGFDDDSILRLSYGGRAFFGRITVANTIELSDETGKILKALPAARADESAELVSEAKAQLTASRKELKQQLGMQTSRLYEAMCAEREWSAADFKDFLLGHPLMARLVSRLIWFGRSGGPSSDYAVFRPDGNGKLVDINDSDFELADASRVQLAHASLMSEDEIAAWTSHLADYAIVPLFDQLGNRTPNVSGTVTEVNDREGWLTDTFSVRGAATKRGYQRGAGEDGGWFSEYLKGFASLNLVVVIGFTGNSLPEENIPAAITTLSFRRAAGRTRNRQLPVADVPRVLLAESYADYLATASSGAFDDDWKKKAGW